MSRKRQRAGWVDLSHPEIRDRSYGRGLDREWPVAAVAVDHTILSQRLQKHGDSLVLAGAVVAAAVILDPERPIEGMKDSKKLTEKRREALAVEIRHQALAWSLGRAEVAEIVIERNRAVGVRMAGVVESEAPLVREYAPNHALADDEGYTPLMHALASRFEEGARALLAAGASVEPLADDGMTMLVVTHEMGFAEQVGDRVIFMADGVIVEDAPPKEIFSNPKEARTRQFLSDILK